MLKCEINTREMSERILKVIEVSDEFANKVVNLFFEHGQWYVVEVESGSMWSVNDAVGGDSIDGFCFDLIHDGCN